MIKNNFTVKSKQDALNLDVLETIPESKTPIGILQISHGMCEHKERYLDFMAYMARQGYICIINDHRGHGKSVKSNDDLGYFYPAGGQGLVEDLHQITLLVKEKHPNLPVFLFGHSMGSLAVRVYAKKYDNEISGLIVCGCPAENSGMELGMKINEYFIRKKGDRARVDLMTRLVIGEFDRKFLREHDANAWICSNKDIVTKYNDDPLCNFTFTLNGYRALLSLMYMTYSDENWSLNNPNLPIRFISGSDDPCMISERKFLDAVEHMKNVGYKDVSYRIFDGMRHEILNETGNKEVYEDISTTLSKFLQKL